ncbi:MAG: transketolase-like TK C-terminal-containing protein, partial [Candidatus Binatia bacterium]
LIVIRPGDANETAVAWRVAIESRACPVALALTRQNVPTLDRSEFAPADGLRRGAYILADTPRGNPDMILIGTGSEVSLVIAAKEKLAEQKIQARVVSMPSWELFDQQPQSYRDSVLPKSVRGRLAVEAALPQGWHRYVGDGGDVVGVERFGASAPGNLVMEKLGFTVSHVVERAAALLGS